MTRSGSDSRVAAALSQIDWNFRATTTRSTSVHSLHWFPGNFIPQIPSFLIQVLTKQGDLVVDCFAGSGTTGTEALLSGRRSWQGDSNRVSALLARAKIAMLIDPELRKQMERVADPLYWSFSAFRPDPTSDAGNDPELAFWYHTDTLAQLRMIWSRIKTLPRGNIQAVLKMLFSDALFACASSGRVLTAGGGFRRHHWGWVADNVRPKRLVWHDAQKLFRQSLYNATEVLKALPLLRPVPEWKFQCADAREIPLPDKCANAIVTSPPYLGMIDYTMANRLTYLWFGWPMVNEKAMEIGARHRRNARAEPERYLLAIERVVSEMQRILKRDGYCAIVIGASRKFPDMVDMVISRFQSCFDLIWGPTGRIPTRRRISERGGTEVTEYVCVWKRR